MKIVLATPLYPPEVGGPATYTKELCERLGEQHDITVVAYARNGEAYGTAKLIQISKDMSLPLRLIRFTIALYSAAKGARVIYAQNAVAAGLPAVIVGMLRRIPVIIKFVGDEAWERASQHRATTKRIEEFLASPDGSLRARLMMKLQGWVLRRTTFVTTPSQYLGELIVRTYHTKPERMVTNYNAAEEHAAEVFPPEHIPHQIVMTARLTAWKGIDGAIRALPLVLTRFPDARLVVAGDGPERPALLALTKELGLADKISFLGNVSRTETWQLRKESDVYVLNSTYEGLPHTVLTSFAAEIPTIATDIPGTNEAVVHEQNGLLIPAEDPDALAKAIIRIFDDRAFREKLVVGGSETLHTKFSWESHLEGLERLFKAALDPAHVAPNSLLK